MDDIKDVLGSAPRDLVIPNDLASRLLSGDPEASREVRVRVEKGRRAHTLYPNLWAASPAQALQRWEVDGKMTTEKNVDWHDWTREQLLKYIYNVRQMPCDIYGRYCHWIGCEANRMDGTHFCTTHELVARANEYSNE